MQNQILSHLQQPGELEKLYRANKSEFKRAFQAVYPQIQGRDIAEFWQERLRDKADGISWGSQKEHLWVILAILFAGFLAKIPEIFSIDEEWFYPRNISFIVLPLITAFFAWKNELSLNAKSVLIGITGLSLVYINSLPGTETDTLILACIHLPLLLWGMLGVAYSGPELGDWQKHLDFLRFNGEAAVLSVLIGIAAFLLSAITIGLFSLIEVPIEDFWAHYVAAFGLPAIPILGTYLAHSNPQLVNKVSPVIAKIFSPIMLVMLVFYLIAIAVTGKDPYNDREFLLLFNLLLIGVMALIFFSVAESSSQERRPFGAWTLFLLSLVTIIVNGIAISAIIFRISELGFTPNRTAVLGGNLLMLIHLFLISWKLYHSAVKKAELADVGKSVVRYLPVYMVWSAVVVFVLPVLFGFE